MKTDRAFKKTPHTVVHVEIDDGHFADRRHKEFSTTAQTKACGRRESVNSFFLILFSLCVSHDLREKGER